MGEARTKRKQKTFDKVFWAIFGAFLVVIVLLLFLPYWLTHFSWVDFTFDSNASNIGETIGGILGPFIAIAASTLTFFAFWVQFIANKQQRDDIARERFESQFYEMLRTHNSNVSEMEIQNSRHQVKGRKLFLRMFSEFKFVYQVFEKLSEHHFKELFKEKDLIQFSYLVFFHGVDIDVTRTFNPKKDPSTTELFKMVKDHLVNKVRVDYRDIVRDEENYDDPIGILPFQDDPDPEGFKMLFYPFDGHLSRLPHYYRHLFQMVCFIVEEEDLELEYHEKYRYLKMLRAQLSNFEQLLLYYNSFVYGKPWQDKKIFTEYKFIKNLPLVHADFGIKPHDLLGIRNSRDEYIFEDDEYEAENK